MKDIIKEMIEKAIWYKEDLNFIDEAYDLLRFVNKLIFQLTITINCPSDWRDISYELAKEYKDNSWVYEELDLWNYEEGINYD